MEVDGEFQQGGELSTNETDKEKRDHMEEDPMSIHEGYLLGYCDSVDYGRVKNLKQVVDTGLKEIRGQSQSKFSDGMKRRGKTSAPVDEPKKEAKNMNVKKKKKRKPLFRGKTYEGRNAIQNKMKDYKITGFECKSVPKERSNIKQIKQQLEQRILCKLFSFQSFTDKKKQKATQKPENVGRR